MGSASSQTRSTHTSKSLATVSASQAATQVHGLTPQDGEGGEWKHRIHAYTAQALIVFNVYGIPLSFGPYLEYYYTTMFPKASLLELSAIIAIQILCIFLMAFPAQWLYQRARWRATIFLAGFAVTACQIALHYCKQVWLLILVQGGIMGLALGILRGMVLLCLASHYKNNVPLASMQSGTVAMFGAFFYSFIAWTCLRSSKHLSLCWMNTVLSGTTLLLAFQQVRKSKGYKLLKPSDDPPRHRILKEKGMLWFLGGYFLLFSGFFVWPTFTVLLVSSPPSNHFPDFGAYVLFITFGCAMVTANYFVRPYSRRLLGPINAYVPFAMVAGVGYIVPAWMPSFLTAATCGVAYGCALGPLLALHIKVLTVFHWSGLSYHPAMVSRINLVSTLAGISAAAGICATAILADARGFGVALTVMGGLMVLGGVLMGIVRFVRCKEFFVAV